VVAFGSIRSVQSIASELGKIIRKYRATAGFSQEELAEGSDLHWTYISQVERGRRNLSVDALRRIGIALRVPAWQLLREAEQRRDEETG
jgi:transcriptional regulator with XRE-family HTH domain